MPTPKRWHPVSRDLNEDAELWAFTDQFGDRSIRIWLEVLALLDRHDNHWRVTGDWVGTLSRKCRVFKKKASAAIAWMIKNEWLSVLETDTNGSPLILASRNFFKFHKRREPSGAAAGTNEGPTRSPGRVPSYPNLPYTNLPTEREDTEGRGGDARGGEGNGHPTASRNPGAVATNGTSADDGLTQIGDVGQILERWPHLKETGD